MAFKDWYDAHVMPRAIRCACSAEGIMERRALIVPLAAGKVFELGCGGGINQALYDRQRVTAYAGIDPSPKLLDFARHEARKKGWETDIRQGVGEDIPFGDDRFDTVVCTFTLCSVSDPQRTLGEMKRILKPGGRLLFLEHGQSPDTGVARWQRRIEPMWKPMLGGCHLTRPVRRSIDAAGFQTEPIGEGYMPKMPRWAAWMEWGSAIKAD
jgi:ubiquinone/menaquinone biosynthesis C-methylase UbiE